MNVWSRTAGILIASGIALGAFGAHGLKGVLSPEMLEVYRTAVFYQLVNAVGLLAASAVCGRSTGRDVWVPGILISAGTLIFAGSLYAMVFTGLRWLGAVTPVGGFLLIVGWTFFALDRAAPRS